MSHLSEIFHSLIFKFKENLDNKYKWMLFKSATLSWTLKIPHNLHKYYNVYDKISKILNVYTFLDMNYHIFC